MRMWALAFLSGVLLLQQFAFVPSQYWIVIMIFFAIFLEWKLVKKWRFCRLLAALLFGFAWTLWYAHLILNWSLPKEWESKPLIVRGYIADIPVISEQRTTFLFHLKKMQDKKVDTLIKLSWQNQDVHLHAGDQWQFVVHIKRIHGLMNPGGFDYEAWAFQEAIRASGYVLTEPHDVLLSSHWYHYPLQRIREKLKEAIEKNIPLSATSPWIVALALGERQNITAENWDILRKTGTNHLMAIAGLHIGLMASFIFFLIDWCWRRAPYLTLIMPSQSVGAIAAFAMAISYSALAGFSIPTERACIMLSITLILLTLKRIHLAWQAWCIAMLCVLLLNPLSVLTESFWLSFCSVALIIYGISGRLAPKNLWWKIGRIQWVIALGLMPLSIWLFHECSLISFIANSIAIPWVGFIVVPLTLLGCFFLLFSSVIGGFILMMADKALAILWIVLTYLSKLSWASWTIVMPLHWILLIACLGMVVLLLPSGFPGRYFGLIWLLPLLFYHYPAPRTGEVWFTLLDVGQGLSAVIQTAHHVLVFDAGPKLSSNYDMGESVVAPFLHSIGAKKIDMLVVSHGDNDHVGGASALFQDFLVLTARTSDPKKLLPLPSQYCLRGETWEWDKVTFTFLYPALDRLDLDNNSSCVLRITDEKQKHILLTGDIEKMAEKFLLQVDPKNLSADILVAPHHGSKTSAIMEFIHAVNPQYVLFPVGYRNRYHFPNPSVIEKYRMMNAALFSTVDAGAIQTTGKSLMLYRLDHKTYWD
jgi:competence protein ComEC